MTDAQRSFFAGVTAGVVSRHHALTTEQCVAAARGTVMEFDDLAQFEQGKQSALGWWRDPKGFVHFTNRP